MTHAFVFPGQGSQAVGMARDLAEAHAGARDVLERVDAALGFALTAVMWDGPAEALTRTENAQPALLAASMAALAALGDAMPAPAFVAGHSLGEYSALVAAGALELEDAARLVRLRGQAMQRAVPEGAGAMAAILGLDMAAVEAVADAAGCWVANDNAPGQVVISGAADAVARAAEAAKGRGAKRAVLLPVSAPFHCPLMGPAADEMAQELEKVEFSAPRVPVVCNVSAAAETDPGRIRALLVEQVTGRVRWTQSMRLLAARGATELYEVGPGKVLSGLARRCDAALTCTQVGTAADVAGVRPAL
jgi:[acyl-carrier-protein] S-malonyltransferase